MEKLKMQEITKREILELHEIAKRKSDTNTTILHIASRNGSIEQVEYILREFADQNYLVQTDSNEETALHVAAYCDHVKMVGILINEAARCLPTTTSADDDDDNRISCFKEFIRHPNGSRNTALHLAVGRDNMYCAERLLQADPDDKHIQNCDGATPLYLAASLGYSSIVLMICEICTSPTFDGPQGRTALHAAISMFPKEENYRDEEVFAFQKENVEEDRGFRKGREEEHNAGIKSLIYAARRSVSRSEFEAFVRQGDSNMNSAMHLAVIGKHLSVVDIILEAYPTFPHHDKNKDTKSPIYIAAEKGYTDIVLRLFLTAMFCNQKLGPRGKTVLHAAILGRNADCVRALLVKAAGLVTYGDDAGWTALHYAAYYKFDSVLGDIIETYKSLFGYEFVTSSAVSHEARTPHCIAAKEGHTSTLIELMLLLPNRIVEVNYQGQNVLHIAAGNNHKEMIRCILMYCPPEYTPRVINQKDGNGDTPLHLLIKNGCFVPQLITHNGVDTMARNKQDWTPIDMLYFNEDIVADQFLIKKAFEIRAYQKWNFWKSRLHSTLGKILAPESIVPPRIRSRKDASFKLVENHFLREELALEKERVNTQIIVTVLIATVTFTVGFTLPGGYQQSGDPDEGMSVLSKKTAFNVFMVADVLALLLSTSSLFIFFILNMYRDPLKVAKLNAASTSLNIASVIAMMLTFMMGTYVVLSHSPALAITVCVISCFFFLLVIVLLVQMIFNPDLPLEKIEA